MEEVNHHSTTEKLMKHLESFAGCALDFVQSDEFIEAYKNIFTSAFEPADKSVRPPLAGSSREAVKIRENLHNYVINQVKEMIKDTIESECLDDKFRKLHQLKLDNSHLPSSRTAWRPPGNPEEHMKPFRNALKKELRNELKNKVTVERAKLNLLKAKLEVLRNRVQIYDQDIKHGFESLRNELQ